MDQIFILIAIVLVGAWVFRYLASREQGKSKKEAYLDAGKHVSKQGPGAVIYIVIVFGIILLIGMIFG